MSRRDIGPERPCFIIAEAGVNHNGDLGVAEELINVAANAGADAVKFQTFETDRLVTRNVPSTEYQRRAGFTNQYEMLADLELPADAFEALAERCTERGLEFMSTPYDRRSVALLDSLGVDRLKVASADIVNKPLIEEVSATGAEVILSTGMATLEEIGQAIGWLYEAGTEEIVLLHCVSEYPADPSDLNLRFIRTLARVFDVSVGFSDHTLGHAAPVAAVALGARVIEKHFTLDTAMEGPDHEASLEPDELTEMVTAIRKADQARGASVKRLTDAERANASKMRTSLHTTTNISAGDRLTRENVSVVRPADGLQPRLLDQVLGSAVNRDIPAGAPLTWEVLE